MKQNAASPCLIRFRAHLLTHGSEFFALIRTIRTLVGLQSFLLCSLTIRALVQSSRRAPFHGAHLR